MTDLQLGANVLAGLHTTISGKSNRNSTSHDTLLISITDKGIVPNHPFAICVFQMFVSGGLARGSHGVHQIAFPRVVVLGVIQFYHALPLHIGLPSQQENFEGLGLGRND